MLGAPNADHPSPPRGGGLDSGGGLRTVAIALYAVGMLVLVGALLIRQRPQSQPVYALDRGLAAGEVGGGLPKLNPNDPMANAAVLNAAMATVAHPGLRSPVENERPCRARARWFTLLLSGKLSRVRFGARTVCQLQLLKQVSVSQPGVGPRGVAEVAAFVLGRRLAGTPDVDVTRLVVPPFRFNGDSLYFEAANLGPLQAGEQLIGTYHTHPEGEIEQGVLSDTDLAYMKSGSVDFAGQVGSLDRPTEHLDWLFDIVEPREGDWNVYAHDAPRLLALSTRCQTETPCPLNELRIAGSPHYLLARYYEEADEP